MNDGFVKSPDAALRFILPLLSQGQAYCGVRKNTPHSSRFARLACGLFTRVPFLTDGKTRRGWKSYDDALVEL